MSKTVRLPGSPPPIEPDELEGPIRRPLATCDPDVLGLYERCVILRSGIREFRRCLLEEGAADWYVHTAPLEHFARRIQLIVETLQ